LSAGSIEAKVRYIADLSEVPTWAYSIVLCSADRRVSCSDPWVSAHHSTLNESTKTRYIRMDDIARPGIKEELTTRDEYLDDRFVCYSSGHDSINDTG
jgi:hypothetical protein